MFVCRVVNRYRNSNRSCYGLICGTVNDRGQPSRFIRKQTLLSEIVRYHYAYESTGIERVNYKEKGLGYPKPLTISE